MAIVLAVNWWALALRGALAMIFGLAYVVVRARRAGVDQIAGEWRLVLGGIASLAFGTLLMVAPATGALAMMLWIGAWALSFGATQLALAFRVRSLRVRAGAARDETDLRRAA